MIVAVLVADVAMMLMVVCVVMLVDGGDCGADVWL